MTADLFLILVLPLVVLIAPIVGAFLLDRRRRRLRPSSRPYGWGYYNGLAALLVPVFLSGHVAKTDLGMARVVFVVALCVYVPLGVLTLRRNRWGFLALTVASFNPVLWLLNTVYLKNRWRELGGSIDSISSIEPVVTVCQEPGCTAPIVQTSTVLGRTFYRCAATHESSPSGRDVPSNFPLPEPSDAPSTVRAVPLEPPIGASEPGEFFVYLQEQVVGPYSLEQLRAMCGAGTVTADTMCCRVGSEQWQMYESLRYDGA